MYTDAARAGTRRQIASTASAGKLLGPRHLPLPLFPVGTDLLLPASANRDLRSILGLSETHAADWQVHASSLVHGCYGSEVDVPQVLASAAFLESRPGAVFRSPAGGGEGKFVDSFEEDGPRQLVLKPRFGCQFYSEVGGASGAGGKGGSRIADDGRGLFSVLFF